MPPVTRSTDTDNGSRTLQGGSQVFAPVEHPVLRSVDPHKVACFLRERERYVNAVEEKRKEVPSMSIASYKVSIDRGLLRTMHALGRLDDVASGVLFDDLTSDQIERYIHSIVRKAEKADVNPTVIQDALKGVRVPMNVSDPEARMLEYVHDVFERLDGVGYSTFKDNNPEKTIKLLQSHLYPPHLKAAMAEHLEYQEGLKKKLKDFVALLCKEAVIQDKVNPTRKSRDKDADANRGSSSNNGKSQRPKGMVGKRDKQPGHESHGDRRKELPCLNLECKRDNFKHPGGVRNCPKTSESQAQELIKAYVESKRRNGKSAKQVHGTEFGEEESESTRMGATFAECLQRTITADIGADVNLMPRDLCEDLVQRRADIAVRKFAKPKKYSLAASDHFVHCDRELIADTELHIRHGKSLTIRNLKWLVAVEKVDEPLLGRPIQEALGLDTKKLLEAACDRHRGSVDADQLVGDVDSPDGSISRILSSGLFHSDKAITDDLSEGQSGQEADLGVTTKQELDKAMSGMLVTAVENGLSENGAETLRNMLDTYRDVFCVRLGPGPPADVEGMQVRMKPDATPYITKARRYPVDQREFIASYTSKLVQYGMAKPNRNAEWVSPPLVVPKAKAGEYRLTFDLRRVNQCTQPMSWPMPHIQSELMDFAGSQCFASIDFCAGYWQLPLHEDSQKYHSFLTPSGVFQPTRTLQGAMNSAQNFQSRVEPCFESIKDHLKAWLDDFALHSRSEELLLVKLAEFFTICRQRNLKISALKSVLFDTKLRWCGYVVDKDGVECDPRRLSGLKDGSLPVNAAELSQFVNCLQWMSNYIPDFSARVAPLRDILERAFEKSGKRTSRSVQAIRLAQLSWNNEHGRAFLDLQEQLRTAVKLAHRDSAKTICIYTDASDEHWAAVVTQCEPNSLKLPHDEQMHQPLAFLGSSFNDTQQHWSTFEREAYAVFQAFEKMDYMLACESDIHLFTDHRNLLFVYNPLAMKPTLGRHIVNKVQRWALYMSRFMYTIEHIDGSQNVAADMMTRWYAGYRGKRKMMARRISSYLMSKDIVESPADPSFIWPSMEMIKNVQLNFATERPEGAEQDGSGIWKSKGKVWIPADAVELQVKLLVIAHGGTAGHRGRESTLSALRENYWWRNMENDTNDFVASCIHCLISKTGKRIPRPISLTLHGTKPNEVVHFDFLFMGIGNGGLKYVLVIRDDLSGYLWLCPCAAADSSVATAELARWIRVFSVMDIWVSDQGSHFKNLVMEELATTHNIKHSFTVAYSPWVNGTVEVCMRHIKAACVALLSEFKLGPQDWPEIIAVVMQALNEAPLKRLGKRNDGTFRTPLEVMTGIVPSRNTIRSGRIDDDGPLRCISQVRVRQLINIEKMIEALDKMHKDVSERVTANRRRHIEHHNKQTNIVTPHFEVGDFVLVRRAQDKGHKLSFRWLGPRRITRVVSDAVYEVAGILGGDVEKVHAARLLMYRNDLDGKAVSDKLLEQAAHIESKFEMVEKLLDIGEADDGIFIQVQWLGQPDKTDWTWQAIKELYEDIPERVTEFLSTTGNKKVAKKAKQQLGISV